MIIMRTKKSRKSERERILKIIEGLKLDDNFHEEYKDMMGADDIANLLLDLIKKRIDE